MKSLLTLIILTFSINVFSHETRVLVTRPKPQINLSSTLNHTQQQINETRLIGGTCYYYVEIKTSCSSPANMTDKIPIRIGDADNNEIYGKVSTRLFKRCTMIPVTLVGTCIGKICKLNLARVGSDGWMPETITIYNHDDNSPVTFNFNYFGPQAQNSDFDYCHNNNNKL
ncbi:embryo-specific protein ATS3B [Trifolium repens]|nr:embryo-specific protein ATS3B [Trifolium repens]